MTELVSVKPEVARDQYGRPLIAQPGGNPIPYARVSTIGNVLKDQFALQQWQHGHIVRGLTERPDLLLLAAANRDDEKQMRAIAEQAMEAAKASAKANVGTALHRFTEKIDLGEDVGHIPDEYQADIAAYEHATTGLKFVHREIFTVCDELQIAGTPDGVAEYADDRYITDLKTGSLDYPEAFAVQLAVYAHSTLVDVSTGERTPLDVDQNRAIIIHLPAGTGRCELHWVDIAAGWEAAKLALKVRDWRSRKDLLTPLNTEAAVGNVVAAGLVTDPIAAQIAAAESAEVLAAIWADTHDSGWTDAHTALAKARKAAVAS
jgi:hypothetical protein